MPSVVQDWVQDLPLRQQGVLLLALRGPDGARKESPSKPIIRSMRALALNSGRLGVPMEKGETFEGDAFMRNDDVRKELDRIAKLGNKPTVRPATGRGLSPRAFGVPDHPQPEPAAPRRGWLSRTFGAERP